MISGLLKLAIFASLAGASPLASPHHVTLPYGVTTEPVQDYQASYGTKLEKPLLAYFAIPYAEPPVGKLRFQHPQPPKKRDGKILRNTAFGPVCLQGSQGKQDEDCLTLSVFKPQNADPSHKLPVLIWTHGGGFNVGSGGGSFIPVMVGNAPLDFIAVTFNYRLGAFGFLPSNLTQEAGLLNLGLEDQVMAYEWVQKYIGMFGGDPTKVTIGGQSAGAHACGAHLQHLPKPDFKPPFQQVIMNSGGPTARAWPDWTYELYNKQMDEFLEKTHCKRKDGDASKTFDCLREAKAAKIEDASMSIYRAYQAPPRWPFQPVVDGKYIQQAPSKSWREGKYNKDIAVLTGFNSDEGATFVPSDKSTGEEFRAFFRQLLPGADSHVLDRIRDLYPDPEVHKDSPYRHNSGKSAQYKRLAAAYGDYAYISAVKETAENMSRNGSMVWKYHFDYASKPGEIVAHGAEGRKVSREDDDPVAKMMNAYYTSFIVFGDPSTQSPKDFPKWPSYTLSDPKQMTFRATEPVAVLNKDDIREEQIAFWQSIPDAAPH